MVWGFSINLTAIFVADFIGALLLIIVLFTKGWNLPTRRVESRLLFFLILATLINCIIDPFVFASDGRVGSFHRGVVLYGNSLIYLYDIVFAIGFFMLIIKHVNEEFSLVQRIICTFIASVETVLLILNLFFPLMFSVDESNSYHREKLYPVYTLIAIFLLVYGIGLYLKARIKDGVLRYFPVWEFVLPVIVGVGIQALFYGISLQPACFAIAFCGIVISIQNESLYLDKLTGVYNRYELDQIQRRVRRSRSGKIAAIMLDMNNFKAINDNYSHEEGDQALVNFASILMAVSQGNGSVIRFAGDEFVIIINSASEDTIIIYRDNIQKALNEYNANSGKPYKLSAAIGGAVFDLKHEGISDFMNKIDHLMYEDKKEYYRKHDRRANR